LSPDQPAAKSQGPVAFLLILPHRFALFFEAFNPLQHILGFHQGIQKKITGTLNGLGQFHTQVFFNRLLVQSND
jgi:hypothetical protein